MLKLIYNIVVIPTIYFLTIAATAFSKKNIYSFTSSKKHPKEFKKEKGQT